MDDLFFSNLNEQIRREDMLQILKEKAKLLPGPERRHMGEQLINLADEYGVKYLSLTLPPPYEDDEDYEDSPILYLFPSQTYRASLLALEEVLRRPCNCTNPQLSHKYCTVNIKDEYTTTDAWFLGFDSYHILANPRRIRELAEELECPYQLLSDQERNLEIIDWVDTGEKLGWSSPPERRRHFMESGAFHRSKDEFDENADVYTLYTQYITWVKSETDERKKVKLLNRAIGLLHDLGTNDGYIRIFTKLDNKKITYLIPYLSNKTSINILYKALIKEGDTHNPSQNKKLRQAKCRCGIVSASNPNTIQVHDGNLDKKLISKREVDTKLRIDTNFGIIKNLVDSETLKEMLVTSCPYLLLDNISLIIRSD